MKYLELQTISNPSFEQIKETPKSVADALWLSTMLAFPVAIWAIKSLVAMRIKIIQSDYENRLKEEEHERKRQDALIQNLIYQNEILINEREHSRIRKLNAQIKQ